MANIRRELEGRNAHEVFAEFIQKDHWIHSRSEEGWWRVLNWMTGLALEVEFDQNGIITRHYWSK
jgi:hypothetical protein